MNTQTETDTKLFTIEDIAEYIAGWASSSFNSVERVGKATLLNALSQLRDHQDGIAAFVERKEVKAIVDQIDEAKRQIKELSDQQDAIFTQLLQSLEIEKGSIADEHIFDYVYNDFPRGEFEMFFK